MTEKLAVKPKKLTIPKSLGACADKLFQIRQNRLKVDKISELYKAQESELRDHIINTLPKGDTGAAGKTHTARVVIEDIPQAESWEEVYEYIRENKAFDLLNRQLNKVAVRDRMEAGKVIPGIKLFKAVKVSLTKNK